MKNKVINPYRKWTGCQIPNWLLKRREISKGAKLCYSRLIQYAGQDGKAFPKQKVLAEELGIKSDRTVRKYLKELETQNLLKIKQRGKMQSNRYFFLDHEWIPSERNDSTAHSGTKGPCTEEQTFRSQGNNCSGPYEENQLSKSVKNSAKEMIDFIASDLNEVQKLDKQLTLKEASALIDAYGLEMVMEKLEAMENYKGLTKKYKSVYLTINSWCKRNMKNGDDLSSTLRPGAIDL